jgi:hypothetical protein
VGDVSSSFWQLHSPGIISLILNYTDGCTEVLLSYPKLLYSAGQIIFYVAIILLTMKTPKGI